MSVSFFSLSRRGNMSYNARWPSKIRKTPSISFKPYERLVLVLVPQQLGFICSAVVSLRAHNVYCGRLQKGLEASFKGQFDLAFGHHRLTKEMEKRGRVMILPPLFLQSSNRLEDQLRSIPDGRKSGTSSEFERNSIRASKNFLVVRMHSQL